MPCRKKNQFKAIDWLAERGVTRILTHGGPAGTPIEDNFDHLKELIAYADQRILIFTRWRYFHRKRSNCDGHFKSHRSPWHKNCLISCSLKSEVAVVLTAISLFLISSKTNESFLPQSHDK